MNYAGRKVLVTGAGGFIGSHLTEALVREGASVTAMVRYNSSGDRGMLAQLAPEMRAEIKIVSGTVDDSDFVMSAVAGHDIVFHLAALIAIPYSYLAPRSYVRTNVEGTLNVLEAARRLGTSRVVHTSTSEVYGTALRTPIDEDHPLQGQSPYSASKIGADKIAESYHRSFGVPVTTVRPFNTYGPRQSNRAFIPTIISQALSRDTIMLGALDPERDMTFVTDTAAGFLRAGLAEGVEGETCNLGCGETHSIGWFAERILALMGVDKPIRVDSARIRPAASEVKKLISDNSRAKARLGWEPTTSLDDGLNATIDYLRENIESYRSDEYGV
ncbi:GDP-mannose 4,6-dehydratase [Pseudohoeflea coraliihabitans]|uniref:GDP-mannose 4,6-dehydratase n=1 Tax=Pseudohoeflea coraliihabitans TaxID=2860393 RepID=A0ABS6WMR3_9HYPH|nr:GDP-mannose 4,6-dehydratase [Pseudohoeflea sp. DP4N28-3]